MEKYSCCPSLFCVLGMHQPVDKLLRRWWNGVTGTSFTSGLEIRSTYRTQHFGCTAISVGGKSFHSYVSLAIAVMKNQTNWCIYVMVDVLRCVGTNGRCYVNGSWGDGDARGPGVHRVLRGHAPAATGELEVHCHQDRSWWLVLLDLHVAKHWSPYGRGDRMVHKTEEWTGICGWQGRQQQGIQSGVQVGHWSAGNANILSATSRESRVCRWTWSRCLAQRAVI